MARGLSFCRLNPERFRAAMPISRLSGHPRLAHCLDWLDAAAWLWSAWQFNAGSLPAVLTGAALLYAAALYAVWGSGVLGNDKQGSLSYGASLLHR